MILTKRFGWVAGLLLWRWHGNACLLCLCEQKLLNSVVKLIIVIFGGLDHGSEGLYEFVATGVPAPDLLSDTASLVMEHVSSLCDAAPTCGQCYS